MDLFEIAIDPATARSYAIRGEHQWSLPAVICDVCGSRWKSVGESYPTTDVTDIAKRFPRDGLVPLAVEPFNRLRDELRALVPEQAVLRPGASLGRFVGSVSGRTPDVAWHEAWTMFFTRSALEILGEAGVRLPSAGQASLRYDTKAPSTELFEPEGLPLIELARESYAPPVQPRCQRCGRQPGTMQQLTISSSTGIPDDVDLFRARNNTAIYLGTARLADAIRKVGLKGIAMLPLKVL